MEPWTITPSAAVMAIVFFSLLCLGLGSLGGRDE